MNYNNERIKTTGESIQYLNAIILGLSSTNGVIPKAYNSAYTIQERLTSLEEKGVPAALLDEVNQALEDLDNAVNDLESQVESILFRIEDTGWSAAPDIGPNVVDTSDLFIRKIGNIVNIMGWADVEPLDSDKLLFTLPVNFRPKQDIFDQVEHEGTTKSILIKTDGRVEWTWSDFPQGISTITLNIMFRTA